MTREELKNGMTVRNIKYGNSELIILSETLMKDSVKGWIPAVVYAGIDRFSGSYKMFVKEINAFLAEFEKI